MIKGKQSNHRTHVGVQKSETDGINQLKHQYDIYFVAILGLFQGVICDYLMF
jgi:hypothetical protein